MMHSVWVRYTETRFLWTPKYNRVALFAVGMSAAIVRGGLLGVLIKNLAK
jgi:DHA1 family tetracycline resistance protein-like MFS transporter